MSRFIGLETNEGVIALNTDNILRVVRGRALSSRVTIYLRNGSTLDGYITHDNYMVRQLNGPSDMIAAHEGYILHAVYGYSDYFSVDSSPIIGWRLDVGTDKISLSSTSAISLNPHLGPDDDYYPNDENREKRYQMVQIPDGRVYFGSEPFEVFKSLEEALLQMCSKDGVFGEGIRPALDAYLAKSTKIDDAQGEESEPSLGAKYRPTDASSLQPVRA